MLTVNRTRFTISIAACFLLISFCQCVNFDKLEEVVDLNDTTDVYVLRKWLNDFIQRARSSGAVLLSNEESRVIKYKIVQYTEDQSVEDQLEFVRQGFNVWQTEAVQSYLKENSCTTVSFEYTEGDDNDISVRFDHNINSNSGYSKRRKTIYINDKEDLSKAMIIQRIAHEAGHVLGLGHSFNTWDVMNGAPSRRQMVKNVVLTDTDKVYLLEALGCITA